LKTIRALTLINVSDLDEILDACELENLKISLSEMQKLKRFVNILEPFEDLTDQLQGEQYVTISLVVPSAFILLDHLECIEGDTIQSLGNF
jgi:hypothetical protein